jgi:serralysin
MGRFVGTDAADTLEGTDGRDTLIGNGGDDHLIGNGDVDRLIGGAGADILEGGAGNDVYLISGDRSDTIIDISGVDTIQGTVSIDLEDYPTIENFFIMSHASGKQLLGNSLDNEINDWDGNNVLDGREGDDYLVGNAGNDILIGGLGVDVTNGSVGNDRHDFYSVAEMGVGRGFRDRINEFHLDDDTIHLGRIDADTGHSGNQAFTFLGATSFTGNAGELVTYLEPNGTSQPTLVLAGDVNGDGVADFEIEFRETPVLTAADFIL